MRILPHCTLVRATPERRCSSRTFRYGYLVTARERIHRAMADARLLANPASWSRVADSSPNWEGISGLDTGRPDTALCTPHCNTCVAPDVRAVLI